MAFANAGAAAGLIAVTTIVPNPGATGRQYVGTEVEYTGAGGAHVSGAPTDDVQTIVIVLVSPLSAYSDATVDGSADDTGILTTAAAAANQHGLPTNFGPGRGNWTVQDLARLSIELQVTETAPAVSQGGQMTLIALAVSGGDLVATFKNQSTAAPEGMTVRLRYDHSMVF